MPSHDLEKFTQGKAHSAGPQFIGQFWTLAQNFTPSAISWPISFTLTYSCPKILFVAPSCAVFEVLPSWTWTKAKGIADAALFQNSNDFSRRCGSS